MPLPEASGFSSAEGPSRRLLCHYVIDGWEIPEPEGPAPQMTVDARSEHCGVQDQTRAARNSHEQVFVRDRWWRQGRYLRSATIVFCAVDHFTGMDVANKRERSASTTIGAILLESIVIHQPKRLARSRRGAALLCKGGRQESRCFGTDHGIWVNPRSQCEREEYCRGCLWPLPT
jgi:hypothetical protein